MAKKTVKKVVKKVEGDSKSLVLSKKGIRTSHDFAALMATLMTDLLSGKVPPTIGSVFCNAGGKLLKVIELQQRYGKYSPDGMKLLILSGESNKEGQEKPQKED